MSERFSRNELYWGAGAQKLLGTKHVAVFGLGGVGGYCAESLARAGIGRLTIVDFDKVSESNINRQTAALTSTIDKKKTDVIAQRLIDINPKIKLNIIDDFYTNEAGLIEDADFTADAIDTLRSKISLLENCYRAGIPVISSLGAGNRIAPEMLYICDISEIENKNAPFISNCIYQLKKLGIEKGITVVASREKPYSREKISTKEEITTKTGEKIEFTKITPASTPFVASCAGIFMASYIVRKLIEGIK